MMSGLGAVALIGLPRTGKSTYIGALWQLAQDPRENSIVERDVTGDRSYLQELGDQVARGTEIARTEVSSREGMRLTLGFDSGDIALDIPDLGGETFRMLVENRIWHPLLDEAITSASAMLMFLHPEKLAQPITISMAKSLLKEARKRLDQETTTDSPSREPNAGNENSLPDDLGSAGHSSDAAVREIAPPEFQAKVACTVAKYVDGLENILERRRNQWPIRLGIVVSAWDTVDASPTPAEWLQEQTPALAAFAAANSDMIDTQVFGVSALGRNPVKPGELAAMASVRERAYARAADGSAISVAEPLRWALWG